MFWVYVLKSDVTGRRYTGSCGDLDHRLHEHNAGQNPSTRHGVPWTLVHSESYRSKVEAVQRERFLKTGRGRDELDRVLKQPQLG